MFEIRATTECDIPAIEALYFKVASFEGRLARTSAEISRDYVTHFVSNAMKSGISLVAIASLGGRVIGEIHAYALGPKVFAHVLGELTIAVDPDHQGHGVGRKLFERLLSEVEHHRPDILRVELIARESNSKAISFYQKLGFHIEGRMTARIRGTNHRLEADIPMAWIRKSLDSPD